MNFEEIYQQVDKLKGWMPKEDCRILNEYVSWIKNGLIVEIGSFMGRSTLTMALSSPTSKIISIDPYLTVHSSSGETDPLSVRDRCIEAMEGQNWKLKQTKSETVGRTWTDLIDFLLIDGDHHIKALRQDIELFVSHVKKGCWVFFHDYNVGGFNDNTATYESIQKVRKDKEIDDQFEQLEDIGAMVKLVVNLEKDKWFDKVITNPGVYGWAICRKS